MPGLAPSELDTLLDALEAATDAGDTVRAKGITDLLTETGYGPAAPAMGVGMSALHGAGQGFSFGLSDEGYGGIRAAFDREADEEYGDAYARHRDDYRATLAQSREDNPWATGLGEVGGGLLTGGLGGARALGGMAARTGVRHLAGVGAATGGGAGFGYSDADSLGGIAADTAIGAGLGGGLGGALGGIGKGATAIRQAMKNRNPDEVVNKMMGELVEGAKLSYDDVNQLLRENPKLVLADISDEFRDMLMMVGGPAQLAKLEERARGTTERTIASLTKGMGDGARRDVNVELLKQAKQIADDVDPLYKAAYGTIIDDPVRIQVIDDAMKAGSMKQAAKRARKMWGEEHPGQPVPENPYDVEMLDLLEQGLDDLITSVKVKQPKFARALINTKEKFSNALEQEVPELRAARDLWRGKHRDTTAANLGKEIFKPANLDDIDGAVLEQIEKFLPSERHFFKMGVMKSLEAKLNKADNLSDITKFIRDRPNIQRALKSTMNPSNFNRFMKRMDAEGRKAATYKRGATSLRRHPVDPEKASLKENLKTIGASIMADAALGTSGGIATHAAYRALIRNQIAKRKGFGAGSTRQDATTNRLMSNAPINPTQALTIPPLAFKRTAGAAGTLPATIQDLLQ